MITTGTECLDNGLWMGIVNVRDSNHLQRQRIFKVTKRKSWETMNVDSDAIGILGTKELGFQTEDQASEAAMLCRVKADGY